MVPAVFILGLPMPPKANPAKLNPLQLRTLTLLQAIARIPGAASPHAEWRYRHHRSSRMPMAIIFIWATPRWRPRRHRPGEPAVWNALTRKGMIKSEWPHQIALTPDGPGL